MKEVGQKKIPQLLIYLFLFATTVISVFPFYWMFVIASNTTSEVNKFPPAVIPGRNFIENAQRVFERIDFFGSMFNTIIIASTVTIGVLFFCSLAGFAFAKLKFEGKNFLFLLLLLTLAVPPQLGIIPLFMIVSSFNWVDSLKAVIIPNLISAFGVFWMRQYIIQTIPDEIIESARIDGCGNFRIYASIILPVIKPALALLGIVTFFHQWNDFLWPLIVLKDNKVHTIQIALRTLNDVYNTDHSLILAGVFLATIPILIMFILFSKHFIAGLTEGAVKN
ncbi:carbohydrate ABC transporter permease [Bacillus alkalicellulosilyticus]|uniref:carbohydrate ABC transporter permease n=1 Tax=Alkalihalobacterium alkalicellulosilyticum TaxID=1912214 RepID=UPI000998C905|nr:carbohydrate ABC transporter permease [Bacillus alkalicellulosilyticus]